MQILSLISLLLVFFLPLTLSLFDYIVVVRSRLKSPKRKLPDIANFTDDFTLLVPIFGNIAYLKNVSFLKKYARHVLLCTTTKESIEFNTAIESLCKKYHFSLFRSKVPIATQYARIRGSFREPFNKDLARDELMRECFSVVKTKYSLFLDADAHAKDDLYHLFGLMEKKKYAIASVRVLVARQNTLIQKLQAVEYQLSMDSRKIYPWLTSGAATIAKTDVLKLIMRHHSLYYQGGDIELGRLAMKLGKPVGHIPFNFYTDVPNTFYAWWKQRLGWYGGGFRHSVINFHSHGLKYPSFTFYNSVLVFFTLPLRWLEIIEKPIVVPLIIMLYWALILIFHWRQKQWFYILFPFYSLFQIMILVPLGIYSYFRISFSTNNVGLIKLRF